MNGIIVAEKPPEPSLDHDQKPFHFGALGLSTENRRIAL